MTADPHNLFSEQQSSLTPGRIIAKTERYQSPTGQVVQLRRITSTLRDDQGIWRTEQTVEIDPPLADGLTPGSSNDIRECFRCLSLIHVHNSHTCPGCCQCYCLPCTEIVKVEDREIKYCKNCAKEAQTPKFLKVAKKLCYGADDV